MLKKKLRNQKGFTLIEIIAVLVILGILAAVAIPRFMDMQQDAREKALDGACAAVASNVSLSFAKRLLAGDVTTTAITYATTGAGFQTNLGDFTATAPAAAPADGVTGFSVAVTATKFTGGKTCTIANPIYKQ
jgi:prepilin-type N-terminal cleavage/methylation domain-containing protein